jgi:hypothetical protein
MGIGITTAKGLEVGHRNVEEIELVGTHSADAPPIGGGYIKVVSIVSIYVFYEWKVVHWKMLVLDKEALWSGGSQPIDLDISLILTGS